MAIIYSYPDNTNILLTDLLIGTSTVRIAGKKKNLTKNFTVEALGNFISLNNPTVWGNIVGNLQDQTDLWSALESKQGNITLTTNGVDGPSTFIADVLNIPDYSAGVPIPTLDQVLLAGNISLLDAKIGELFLHDNANGGYGKIRLNDNIFSIEKSDGNELLYIDDGYTFNFRNSDNGVVSLFNPLTTTRYYTFPDKDGTFAMLSDITGGTLQEVTDAGNTTTNEIKAVASGLFETVIGPNYAYTSNIGTTEFAGFSYDGYTSRLLIGSNSFETAIRLKAISLSAFDFLLPNDKPAGTYTIATTDDIPSIGTWGSLNYPIWSSGTPFVKMTAAGTFALDTNIYLTGITSSDITTALGYTPVTNARTLTINGTTYDLTADRSWTISTSPLTTKGDLYTFNTANARLPVGLDNQVLISDSTQPTGLKWSAPSTPTPLGYYGAFQDMLTQTLASVNVGQPFLIRTIDDQNQVSITADGSGQLTRITPANTGVYNIQWSGQFQNPTNDIHNVNVWFRKGLTSSSGPGTDIVGSNGVIALPARKSAVVGEEGRTVSGWNFLLSIAAGEYVEFYWMSNSTQITLQAYPAGSPPPSTASLIVTVTQQSGIMAGTGITAINSLTGAAQTLTVGTTGTDFAIVDSGTDHKFNLPDASATARGLVTINGQTLAGAKTFSSAPILSSLTASQLLALDASKNIQSLSTATYPSLTELSYAKGVTSSIQTQLNNVIRNLIIDNTQIAITGVTSNTLMSSYLIPANTIKSTDKIIRLESLMVTKVGGAGTWAFKLNTNTIPSLTGSVALTGTISMASTAVFGNIQRTYYLGSSNLRSLNVGSGIFSDFATSTAAMTTTAFDITVDNYILVMIIPTVSTDVFTQQGINLTIK